MRERVSFARVCAEGRGRAGGGGGGKSQLAEVGENRMEGLVVAAGPPPARACFSFQESTACSERNAAMVTSTSPPLLPSSPAASSSSYEPSLLAPSSPDVVDLLSTMRQAFIGICPIAFTWTVNQLIKIISRSTHSPVFGSFVHATFWHVSSVEQYYAAGKTQTP